MKRAIFNEVVEWIESRLTINPAVDDIACGVGYSRRFVYNLFHEHAGLPVGKYIRMRRMTLAAGKLKLTQQSISSIACLLHFDSHQTFSREFKKTFGLSPGAYRDSTCWDMSLLYQKVAPQGGGVPAPYLCFLEEQSFAGYGFNYTLSLTDDIATRKEVTRRKIAGGATGADRDIYILSACSPLRTIYIKQRSMHSSAHRLIRGRLLFVRYGSLNVGYTLVLNLVAHGKTLFCFRIMSI